MDRIAIVNGVRITSHKSLVGRSNVVAVLIDSRGKVVKNLTNGAIAVDPRGDGFNYIVADEIAETLAAATFAQTGDGDSADRKTLVKEYYDAVQYVIAGLSR